MNQLELENWSLTRNHVLNQEVRVESENGRDKKLDMLMTALALFKNFN